MDYRKRDYYLIRTDPLAYKMRHDIYKIAAPSVKFHASYRYYRCYQEMVSCLKEDSDILEYELRKAQRRDEGSGFIKIDKEILGQ